MVQWYTCRYRQVTGAGKNGTDVEILVNWTRYSSDLRRNSEFNSSIINEEYHLSLKLKFH